MPLPERILIIEDESHIRRLMEMTLEGFALGVASAPDGPTGLARFGSNGAGWALVLLDQRMPGMEGLDVLREIKARNSTVPVVMITAFGSVELAVEAMKLGAVDFVRKPTTPEVLRRAVDAALRARPAATRPSARKSSPAHPDIGSVAINGFRIERLPVIEREARARRFLITQGNETVGREVVIPIEPDLVAHVGEATGNGLEASSGFWTVLAEDLLTAYVWTEGRLPIEGALRVKSISRDDLAKAATWPKDH
jgi:two-component system, NtrC family, response regulator